MEPLLRELPDWTADDIISTVTTRREQLHPFCTKRVTIKNTNQPKSTMITLAQERMSNRTSGKKSSAAEEFGHDDSIERTGRKTSLQATSDAWSHACRMTREKMTRLLADMSCIK
jgi:hypothetical protein